jgi:Flp pilus assembly pilin Flp
MFRKLIKNKKAQNTAEYAILISLVVAGIIAMQTYAQRALQAKVRDAGTYLGTATSTLGATTKQYEPYYLTTNYAVSRNEATFQTQTTAVIGGVSSAQNSIRSRALGGSQSSAYTEFGLVNNI